jgi:hypothetical protein
LHRSETKIKQRAKAFSSMAGLPNLEPSKNLKNQNDFLGKRIAWLEWLWMWPKKPKSLPAVLTN